MGPGAGAAPAVRLLELTEYQPLELEAGALEASEAELIWRQYGSKVAVEEPGFKNDHRWRLVSLGWVGHLPVSPELGLSLRPKVPLGNVFRMLEYAYQTKLVLFDGSQQCESMREFYERLASVLAKRVLDRARRGLYRSYLEWDERLACVRGRIDVGRALGRPWDPSLRCRFEEHTADIEENQILLTTLGVIARGGLCSDRVLPTVRSAYRAVSGVATERPLGPAACLRRLYNRLNDDYQPMHALCRFFLEQAGPTVAAGEHSMIPFTVSMPQLFERFVAEWLRAHLPKGLGVKAQYSVRFTGADEFRMSIDLLVEDRRTGEPLWVLDTKYKTPERPSESDIQQVIAYAAHRNCRAAGLVYPKALNHPIDGHFGDSGIRVRSLTFDLGEDLEANGQRFLGELIGEIL